ncbi:hypothetical protein BK133_28615 [Paenibacillus sp. FSL H8-0548]|uniref:hypothetical protein n=1 Tax=Paenibacillus sp. FSL H8-0548 TaxID=1920422 RepID=UPI00096FD006|nr:hypothetical protein [Paenibacillus sp. FSL H8-0548]OMF21237.1 hypothetical protein BK133_28615 [Paenibacillus sp. FSL H8-0548]
MNISNQEQKRIRLKQFLKILSEDPSLLQKTDHGEARPLSELLMATGCRLCNEPIDMAELMSQLLGKLGLKACSTEMMEYIMNGGTVDDFMNTAQ